MAARYKITCLLLTLPFSLFLFACRPATPPPSSADQTQIAGINTPKVTSAPPTPTIAPLAAEIRNAQYQLGAVNNVQVVQLTDGKFQQGTPGSENYTSIMVTDFVAIGDLNGDGTDEVAALVGENYGGSGVFVFLAVYQNINGTLTFQASTMVDDRPQLNALSIKDGEIFLETVIHGANDPMCCPALRTTRYYRMVEDQLRMTDYTTFTPEGKSRTVTIEAPASGTQVFSSIPIKGNVTIAPFENNLTYRIYDVSGIELSVGALPVTAANSGASGTFDATIPLGKVLSGAVIRLEVQDLSPADGSLLAMDSVELVVK